TMPETLSPSGMRGPWPRHDLRTGGVWSSPASARMWTSSMGAISLSAGPWAQAVRATARESEEGRTRTTYPASPGSWKNAAPAPARLLPSLSCLVEVREVAAEEVARALLHLPDALTGEAPLLAEVLQRARIVLRQAVAEDV